MTIFIRGWGTLAFVHCIASYSRGDGGGGDSRICDYGYTSSIGVAIATRVSNAFLSIRL